ncbi:divergent polysaccharide deacetylase family protein, partial [bacterium]|nr:divergent polysaccharide deacetylase family protein [bacterium]
MGRSKRHFDITLVFSFIFILVCLFAVWSLKEVGREKTPSQPQIMPTETKPTPIYEPLKPLPREEDSIKEKPVEGEPVEEEPYKDEAIIQEPKRELDVIEDKIEVYKKVDPKLEEYIRSFFTELGCKVQDNWVIDVPTVYSIEWLKRRLDLKLLELGYKLNGNIVFKDNEELLRLGFEKSQPKGRIAIIIDDIGRSTRLNRVLEEIDLPLNISILPKQSKSKDMSLVGMKKGWDVLLHLPMEPKEKSWIDSTFIKV